jgi:hypothetical protein
MKLYVYSVCEEAYAGTIDQLRGISDAPLHAVIHSGLAAIVSVRSENSALITPANVRSHNRINLKLLTIETPLPLRFGTVIEEPRLVDYLKANESRLRGALERVRGTFEMGVKILDGTLTDDLSPSNEVESMPQEALEFVPAGKGTAFLQAKQRELQGVDTERERAAAIADWLGKGLSGMTRETSVSTLVSSRLIVRAAHLIGRDRLAEYRARLNALEDERKGELKFLVSGPWPPYSFSDIGQ